MSILKDLYRPPDEQTLRRYVKPTTPGLKVDKLKVTLVEDPERRQIGIPTNGNVSLAVIYESKGRKATGAVSSAVHNLDLAITQLQGGRHGYRITSGLDWVRLVADTWYTLASHPESFIERILMPPVTRIAGWDDATEQALKRYRDFAAHLGMRYSEQEDTFVVDLHKSS